MSKTKQTPRQKMINMMYIVLTALLALNVSKQVLKSFHIMEQGFISSATKLDDKNAAIMNAFDVSMQTDKVKTKPFLIRAKEARKISAEFCEYIDNMKKEVEALGGGRKDMAEGDIIGEINKADAIEKHANYFINNKNGVALQAKINSTREKLLQLLKSDKSLTMDENYYIQSEASTQLKALDPKSSGKEKKTWVKIYLEENPIAGVLAMLTKIKNDAKNLETDVLTKLQEGIYAKDIPINKIEAMIIPKSNYVMSGTNYEAEILLVASNSTSENKITVNGQEIKVVDGKGKYVVANNKVGRKEFSGSILVKGKDGKEKPYTFNSSYQVYKPLATISAENMNVVYANLQNPIAVSVPGFPSDAVIANISNGWSIKKSSNGKYIVRGKANTKTVTITASVKTETGIKMMGMQIYRVKRVPNPEIRVGNLDGSRPVSKTLLASQRGVNATLGQYFNFSGVNYKVLGYKVVTKTRKGSKFKTVQGASLASVKHLIKELRSGDNFIITEIRVSGPNGQQTLGGIPFFIK